MLIQVRRGLEANRLSYTPASGEITFTTDTKKLYVGDGVTPGGILVDLSGGGVVQTIVAGENITVDATDPANPIVSSEGGGEGAVTSVNSQTGAVVLDADDIDDTSTTHKFATAAEKTKLGFIAVTQAVDLDAMESTLASHVANTSNPHSVTKAQVGLSNVPNTDFTAAVAANTAKISFDSASSTKLAGIETGADVTDTANVTAAGALMDSEVTNLDDVKNFDPADYATAAQGATADSAVQPGDLATVATTGDYDDLTGKPTIPDSVDDLSPSQTGNSGKFLKTDGTNATWESIPGGGDMLASTYDPQNIAADAFDQDNMTDGSTNKNYTATEKTKLAGIEAGAEVNTVDSVAGKTGAVTLDKTDVGLSNVDNTSDATKQAATLLAAFPVGSLYFSTNSTNPGTYLGGTWAAFGAGRVPVGFDSGQTEFDTDEETGGAKTVTLTEAEMPAHTHSGSSLSTSDPGNHTHSTPNHTHTFNMSVSGANNGMFHHVNGTTAAADGGTNGSKTTNSGGGGTSGGSGAHTHTISGNVGSTGDGDPHNNLQPYIVVRMWKRTA